MRGSTVKSMNNNSYRFIQPRVILSPIFMILSGIFHSLLAQAPFLAATANKSTVGVGEQFQITFTFNASGRSFQGPDLKDFNVLSGPNQSTNMQFINGNISQSVSFSYFLQAKTIGTFKIGPASIESEGKRIASNVIQLTVVKGNPQAQKGNGNQPNDDQQLITGKNIFARAYVNKSTVLKGEALQVTFKLYSNVNVLDFAIPKMPSFDGFWNQDIQLPQTLERNTEVIDGQRYTVWEIKKLVLFPQQSGTLTIDQMEIDCLARVRVTSQRSNNPFSIFDDPFFGMGGVKDIKYSFKSEPLKILVKELPANAPADFRGAVGALSFDVKLDKNETRANEAVGLKIKISGNGNLKLADIPDLEFPDDLESYEPKISENFKATTSGVTGIKTIEYLIIPRHEGEYEIPALSFTYYDLAKREYISKKAGPFKLKVNKGNGTSASISEGPTEKSEFRMLGNDIRYIKNSIPDFNGGISLFYGSPLFYTLSFVPFLLFGVIAGWLKQQEKLKGNVTLMRMRNATAVAQKRLSIARKYLGTEQEILVFEEIHKASWGYISDKFSIPLSELSKEKIEVVLGEKKVSPAHISSFIKTIDDCEMARYGGTMMGFKAKDLYESAEKVITQIEESVKS